MDIQLWLTTFGAFMVASVLPAAILFAVGVLLIRIAMKLCSRILEKTKLEKVAYNLIKTVLRVVLYALLALITASKLGIDVTGIVALASVLTLAISLSVQNALTNLISGFTLLYTKPFSAGDYVEIAGQSGTVESIGLTYTNLTTPDSKRVFIPNNAVTSAEIVNYTVLGRRRVGLEIAVSYDAPTQAVLAALREAGDVPTRLPDIAPFAALSNYGESTINYLLHVWTTADDYWTTLFAVNEKVREIFARDHIEMTYPHLNIHLDKQ